MKREGLLRHLRRHGCVLRREGKEHTLWENPQTGHAEAVPRHAEIANLLAKRICRRLSIPDQPGLGQAKIPQRAFPCQVEDANRRSGRRRLQAYPPAQDW